MCRALRAQCLATSHPLLTHRFALLVLRVSDPVARPSINGFPGIHVRHTSDTFPTPAHRVFKAVAQNLRPSFSAPARVSDRPSQDLPAIACASRSSIDYKHGIAQLATSNSDQRRYACAFQDDSHSNIPSYYKRQICRRQPECRALEMTPSHRRSGP